MNKLISSIFTLSSLYLLFCTTVSIEEASYEDRSHFRIVTPTATYFLDKAGGGFSRILDQDGIDWVQYNGDPGVTGPEGASGGYRGVPNLVFGSDDGGAGHPGFDQCISEQIDERTIRTRSKSGKWQWSWTFFDDYAQLTMERTDPGHAYWFLYEGPVAGSFNPAQKYWGTNLGGPRYETPSLNHGESIRDHWQWAYFGDKETNRILFVAQQNSDAHIDHFAYMGDSRKGNDAADGMVVFGFGREKGAQPLMKETGNIFKIGFLERKIASSADHGWAMEQIQSRLR